MTKEDLKNIQDKLKEQFAGKQFKKQEGVYCEVADYVKDRVQIMFPSFEFSYRSVGRRDDEILITYKDWGVVLVKFVKKLGETHYGLYGHYCDWYIKDFKVELANWTYGKNTVEELIEEIDAYTDKKAKEEAEKRKICEEAFYLLKEHFGFKTNTEVKNLIKEVDFRYYKLFYRWDEEND